MESARSLPAFGNCSRSAHAAQDRLNGGLRDASSVRNLGHRVIGASAHLPDCIITLPPRVIEREFGSAHPLSELPQTVEVSVRRHGPESIGWPTIRGTARQLAASRLAYSRNHVTVAAQEARNG
jgi:hypothetical protein